MMDLIAGDIIQEHETDEAEDHVGSIRPQDRVKGYVELRVECKTCNAVAGSMCTTAGGDRSDRFHAARSREAKALDSPGAGN